MLAFLLCILTLVFVLHLYFKYNAAARAVRKLPMPREDFLFGCGLELIASPVELFKLGRRYAKTFNGIYGWYSFLIRVVNIHNPEDIEIVISSTKHSGKSLVYTILKPWLRDGLLVSKGAKWLHRRRILTPAFHFNILKRFAVTIEDNSQRLIETLEKTQGEATDIIPVLSEYTLSSICETSMGTRLDEETSNQGKTYKNAVYNVGRICIQRMARVYYFYEFAFNFSSYSKEFYKYLNIVTSFTKKIIQERKEYVNEYGIKFSDSFEDNDDADDLFMGSKKKKVAMLDLMLAAEKEGIIDGAGIQEEVDTFMFEGHDTTAAGLTFCLMLLANHKEIQDKIVQELDVIFAGSSRPATMDDLNAMKYLECCIKEAIRMYPPVHFIGRKLSEDVVLSGQKIPAGVHCHIHIFDMQRRPDLYPEPEKYDPERFTPENCMKRHPYAYIPFSAGPRNCIGQRFAMIEMKSCVSQVLRKFELQPVTTPEDIEFTADLVLRSNKPIYVKFVERIRM